MSLELEDPRTVEPPSGSRRRTVRAVVIATLVAAMAIGVVAWRSSGADNPAIARSKAVTAAELESRYGARIDVVGLLAAGGLIELRFQVIDKDKAVALFGAGEESPELAVEGTTHVLRTAKGMSHKLTLLDGASYFILYSNPGNVVHQGTKVSFVMNDVRLEHLDVQK